MREMDQGEEYDEEEFDGEEFDESEEDTNAQISTIFGIPKMYFFIGVAVLVIVALVLVLFLLRSSGSSNTDEMSDILSESEVSDDGWEDVDSGSSDGGESTESTGSYTGAIVMYDSSGNTIGSTNGATGDDVYDMSGEVIGVISESGANEYYDDSGNVVGYYDNYNMDASGEGDLDTSYINKDLTDTGETNVLDADEMHYQMRAYGYTADEIELAEQMGITFEQLEAEAKAAQDVKAQEALKRMSDHASKEYKAMKKNSIYCMPKIHFDDVPTDQLMDDYDISYIVNADYEKCPTYGLQLFIKVKVANETYAFMPVTPARWKELPEEGNIVLDVSMHVYGADHVNTYITNIVEVDTTKNTVNTKDSGANIKDILNSEGTTRSTDNDTPTEEWDPESGDW